MEKTWVIQKQANQTIVEKLSSELNIDKTLAELLVSRGIQTYDQAKAFFRPELTDLHDPFLMKGMKEAVSRLQQAIAKKETVMIYGDYDVDGTTSVALIFNFLKKDLEELSFYIPDRYTEGYGISLKGIDQAASVGATLIIALDCGVKAVEQVAYAKSLGIDCIICDHHTPGELMPAAVAVLDPLQKDCNYPFKHLSGCGVGFKLLQAYCLTENIAFDRLFQMLDLVCVSIASDIVSMTGENRLLAFYGLKQLQATQNEGLKKLKELAGLKGKITISDIVFKLGPRINAAGRIKTAMASVELLVTDDATLANKIGDEIHHMNLYRRELDHSITIDAVKMVKQEFENPKGLVLYHEDWSKGVLGIVASRIVEEFYRPTIVLTKEDGKITGSARSVEGFNLYEAIVKCSDLLVNFGGHKYAAGLTIKEENLPEFKERFEQIVSETLSTEDLVPKIFVDSYLELSQITPSFFNILRQFAPFGPDNMMPVFVTDNVVNYGTSRRVGKENDHLKLTIAQHDNINYVRNGIGFSLGAHYETISKGNPFRICYCLQENDYAGKTEVQLLVKDLKTIN